jgi:nicotinate phosphoribosyltransferase
MQSLSISSEDASLLTDLYELTMAAAYWTNRVPGTATFELYFRRLPQDRSYLIAAGLEQALDYVLNLRFKKKQLDWLRSLEAFQKIDPGFFDYLAGFRFSGDVWAIPEGVPVFPLEPVMQVRAPLIEAQILETYLLTIFNMQTMIATKAARVVDAAHGKGVIDFGARRAHGPQAALLAARAAYIGGCLGTSNALAGYLMNIPVYGTAAHSYTMAFDSELEAFREYQRVFPQSTVLLLDTYDTVKAAKKLKLLGGAVQGVRLDSGDLAELSGRVRAILDADGLQTVKIFASGDLNEYKIAELIQKDAPIDVFGVGTELVTSYDNPALSGVYKLVQIEIDQRTEYRIKTSPGKPSFPGRKQVHRYGTGDYYSSDMVALADESLPEEGALLLKPQIQNGMLVEKNPSLREIKDTTLAELRMLPPSLHALRGTAEYSVKFSGRLQEELERAEKRINQ